MHEIRLLFDHNSKRNIQGTFEEIGKKFIKKEKEKKIGAQATFSSTKQNLSHD